MTSIVDSLTSLLTARGGAANAPDALAVVRQWTTKAGLAVRRYEAARVSGDDRSAGAALQEAMALFAAAPIDAIRALPGSVSRGQGDLAASVVSRMDGLLTQTRNQLDDPDARPDLAQAQTALAEIDANLDQFASRIRFHGTAVQVLKLAVYALPLIGGYLIAVYFRFSGGGLYAENHAVLAPLLTYQGEARAAQLTFVPGFEKTFWNEFSRYYFERENGFEHLVNDGNVQVKLVFRNPRKADPLIVSTIETTAKFTAEPFPWKNVDVTARVEARQQGGLIVLADKGIGPATDLRYRLDSANVRLIEGGSDLLFHREEEISFAEPTGRMAAVRSSEWEFWPRVYQRVSNAAGELIVDCPDGTQWETIGDLRRLQSLTPTVRGGKGTFAYDYASLRGDRVTGTLNVAMPEDLTYFQRSDVLTDAHPCEPGRPASARPDFPPLTAPSVPELLEKLTPGTPSLKGVDLIVKRISVNLEKTEDGRTAAVVNTPDEILNPGGFLIVYLTLERPKNGKLDLAMRVNGTEVRTLTIPVLAPDRKRFDRAALAEERQRFAAK